MTTGATRRPRAGGRRWARLGPVVALALLAAGCVTQETEVRTSAGVVTTVAVDIR